MISLQVKNQQGQDVGKYEFDPAELAPEVNKQLLHDVVVMYEANRRVGTAATKSRGMIAGSTKKLFKQKGTGRARHHSARAPQFRGGGQAHGPVVRSHAHDLPKKVRALGLKLALSAKAKEGSLVILDTLAMADAKTGSLAKQVAALGWKRVLIIDGAEIDANFARAAANIEGLDVLPSMGANVYDILKRDTLVITRAGVEALEARLA